MAYDIGTARGVIELDYNGRGVAKAKADLDGVGESGQRTGSTMSKVSTVMGGAGLAIAGALALGVNAAANFEERMSAIGAVSGATGGELEALRGKALQLGKDTSFSATESATAMEELVKAGLSVDDVLNGAADATVALAAAGGVDLPQAAEISANAMNQFGLKANDMVGVVDTIAGAANSSAIGVGDFGQSLSQVGAVANLAGVSFDDTATAIALLGNAGIKGSDAGTSLKSMFQRLQPTTKKQSDLFKELGIITADGTNKFYDAEGKTKSLAAVSQVLQNSLKGMTQQQKQATLNTLFGSDAIRAAAVLSNQGAAGFDKMSASMQKTSAAEVAAKRLDNFKGSLEQMKGSLETVGISLGTALLPALRSIVNGVTAMLNVFLNLPSGVQAAIAIFATAVAAILLIGAAIMKIIIFINTFRTALVALRAAMATTWIAALGPIALVIAAIAAIVAIIVVLYKKNETFRNAVNAAWAGIKAAVSAVAAWFTGTLVPGLVGAWQRIVAGLQAAKAMIAAVWNGIKAVVSAVFSAIATVITTYINIWKAVIRGGLNVIKAIWGAFWRGPFGQLIKAAFNLVVAVVRLGVATMRNVIRAGFNVIRSVTSAVWNGIMAVIRRVWSVITSVVRAGANAAKAVVNAGWRAIQAVTRAVWNAIMGVVRAVWSRIGGTVRAGASRAKAVVVGAWNAVKSATTSAWNAVVSAVSSAVSRVGALAASIKGRVMGALSGAGSWLVGAGRAIISGLIAGINSMIGSVTSKLQALTAKVKAAKGPEDVDRVLLKPAGELIMKSLILGFDNMTPAVLTSLGDLTSLIGSSVAAPPPYAAGGARIRPASTDSTVLRLISGELRLDRSGRAYITGVAQQVVDNNSQRDSVGTRRNRKI